MFGIIQSLKETDMQSVIITAFLIELHAIHKYAVFHFSTLSGYWGMWVETEEKQQWENEELWKYIFTLLLTFTIGTRSWQIPDWLHISTGTRICQCMAVISYTKG